MKEYYKLCGNINVGLPKYLSKEKESEVERRINLLNGDGRTH